ncbi:uncharacterized protein [Drosophila tropicalis]|uniref:uncharacterized protein n=1 Tax=Drosophila tropicalis TaxID=46794 RepID=UPI0035AC0B11
MSCTPGLLFRPISRFREHLLRGDFLELEDASTAKTLGIRWQAAEDVFFFTVSDPPLKESISKRQVLSHFSKIFDPAGWLAPFVIRAKIFMQQIWLTKLGWDDVLPPLLLQQWHEFLQDYPGLSQLRIPRWLNTSNKLSWELHGFCDASQKSYGAALYVRVLYGDQFWTDSSIVLAWLNMPPCSWSTFVANRVSSISKSTSGQSWSYLRSVDNPADLASRGVSAAELSASSLWWHGTDWLQRDPEYWPTLNNELPDTQLEQRVQCHTTATTLLDDVSERFSDYDRALRVTAYIQRFATKRISTPSTVRLINDELLSTERELPTRSPHQRIHLQLHKP